jgi:hypothetical protein
MLETKMNGLFFDRKPFSSRQIAEFVDVIITIKDKSGLTRTTTCKQCMFKENSFSNDVHQIIELDFTLKVEEKNFSQSLRSAKRK